MRQRTLFSIAALAAGLALALAGAGGVASAWSDDAAGPDRRAPAIAGASGSSGAGWTLIDRESRDDKRSKGKDEKDDKKGDRAARGQRAPSQPAPAPAPAAPPLAEQPAAPTAAPSPTPIPATPTPDPNERITLPTGQDDRSAAEELRRRLDAAPLTPRQAEALAAALGSDLTGEQLRALKVSELEQLARARGLRRDDLAAVFPEGEAAAPTPATASAGRFEGIDGVGARPGFWQRLTGWLGWLAALWRR
ncbi:MAG TPA: hypothetical protein VGL23_10295 [Chloroflexota bacterium]|jgi:hypothetical protein